MKKTEQNFDLLKSLREAAGKGLAMIEETIAQGPDEAYVKTKELKALKALLEKAEQAQTLEEMRRLINEDSIPVELVVFEQFWGDFQELIYKLSDEREENER